MKQISISSDAFKAGTSLPVEYTCDGEDRFPALSWDTIPAGTQSIALIMDDPDAPGKTWVHWVIYNIPANINQTGVNDTATILFTGDTIPPTIESVTLDAYTTIANATIHVTVNATDNATDNAGVISITADGSTLIEDGNNWAGELKVHQPPHHACIRSRFRRPTPL